jgi:hypothetical protein
VALVLLVVVQIGLVLWSSPVQVLHLSREFSRAAGTAEEEMTSPLFRLERSSQPVSVRVDAPVNNNWLAVNLELVNQATGVIRTGGAEVSFYHGSDSDGAWSEGSRSATERFAAVPAGEYFLRLSDEADASLASLPYTVTVESGGVFWSNFLAAFLLVLAYPVWIFWRRVAFERARWSESDYSPYSSTISSNDDSD